MNQVFSRAISTCWMIAAMVLLTSATVAAQEEFQIAEEQEPAAEEISAEINSMLHEAERNVETFSLLKAGGDRRLTKLMKIQSNRKQLAELEQQIEEAEEADDDEKVEKLEQQFDRLDIAVDESWYMLEFESALQDALILQFEARQDDDQKRAKTIGKLIPMINHRGELIGKLFDARRSGREEQVEEFERQISRNEEMLELRYELMNLERELREAEEEGEEEEVQDIKQELRELEREFSRLEDPDRSREPRDDEPAIEDDASRMPILIDASALTDASNQDFDTSVVPLLKQFCFECHGNESSSGDLNLEKLITERPFVMNRRAWINVLEQTRNRVMPPEDADHQPSDLQRLTIAASVHRSIHQFDYSTVRDPGFEPVRRLTHYEYNNTIRDLFGVDLRPADSFPADLSASSGFDNSANSLFLQPLLMERYLAAAEATIERALPAKRTTQQHDDVYQRIFFPTDAKTELERATTLVTDFARHAWRRPLTAAESDKLASTFSASMKSGLSFDESVKQVLAVALISPNFLLRVEGNRTSVKPWRVSDHELASRLSYFLWSSIPDDELTRLANEGQLRNADSLLGQVDRMLADNKSDTLGEIFAAQWLGYQHLGTRVRADPIDNPWCTDSLMDAMKAESSMFFSSLIRDDLPLTRLIDARFTYLNEELANFYQIEDVSGEQMRRVKLADDNPRGGIFGHGSVLAVTSFPGRTSPVVRGRWILTDVLGTPPPPPPPNVSELSDEIAERDNLSMRRKLELHRRNPNCYTCHSQIDPLGFALENFDWFGRWKKESRGRPVDARGKLPDGSTFSGPTELKTVIVEKRRTELATQLTRKMLAYALGRQLEYYDEAAVQNIVSQLQRNDYRMQTLIREIVKSYPFQYKKRPTKNGLAKATQ